MRTFILPHNSRSRSAKALAQGLGCKLLRTVNSRYVPRPDDRIINWGCSVRPAHVPGVIINSPHCVAAATDKGIALHRLKAAGVPVPYVTYNQCQAQEWVDAGKIVVSRHLTRASGGRGIEIITEGEVPQAPLYTKYIKKTHEYRVHVFKDEVIDTQRKMRDLDVPDSDVNWLVRSHENGFVFGRSEVHTNPERDQIALQAVQALELDFGAVDIIYNQHYSKFYVLEVNTAPGLEGTTLETYINCWR